MVKKGKKAAAAAAAPTEEPVVAAAPAATEAEQPKKKKLGKKRKAQGDAAPETPAAPAVAETTPEPAQPPKKKGKKKGKKAAAETPAAETPAETPAAAEPQTETATPMQEDTTTTPSGDPVELFWGRLPGDDVTEDEAREAIGAGFVAYTQANGKPFGFLTVSSRTAADALVSNPPTLRGSQTRVEERSQRGGADKSERQARTLFVGSVPETADEDSFKNHFAPLEPMSIRFSFKPGFQFGVAFVEFNNAEDANAALNKGDLTIGDTTVRMKLDSDRPDRGGRGGDRGRGRGRDGGRGRGRGGADREPTSQLFLGNCPEGISDDIVKGHFAPYEPTGVRWSFKDGRPGIGFVDFGSVDDAQNALSKGSSLTVDGQEVFLRYATPRTEGEGGRGGGGGGGFRGRGRDGGGFRGRGRDGGRGRGRGPPGGGNQMKQGATGAGVTATGSKMTFDDSD